MIPTVTIKFKIRLEFKVKDFEVINHNKKNNNTTITAISTGIIEQIQNENKYLENPILEVTFVLHKWIRLSDGINQIQGNRSH